MTLKSPELRGFHGIIETAPKSACNTHQGLTRSTGTSREGLPAMVPKTCSINDCESAKYCRGLCRPHYARHERAGTLPPLQAKPTAEERFWLNVEKSSTCWAWTGYVNPYGYGLHRASGRQQLAHRYLFELIKGELPRNVQVDHLCHNRACVNPDHLRPVTNKQNQENRKCAQRNNETSGVRGVSWNKRLGRWHAYVTHNGVRVHVGYFERIEDANSAAVSMRNELFTHNQDAK